jgi:hypothetical protein
MNGLQKWIDRLLGRKPESSSTVPDQRPNEQPPREELTDEKQRELLRKEEKRRDELGSDPPDYDV